MELAGSHRLPASPEQVWDALNDPAVLVRCIPGCESLERLSDTRFTATASVKVGPVRAQFKGDVELLDLNPPHGYRIAGKGSGGSAGGASGGATVTLAPEDGGSQTTLTYQAEGSVTGKLAQLGSRVVDSVARKMADQFFQAFAEEVSRASGGAAAEAEAPEAEITQLEMGAPAPAGPTQEPAAEPAATPVTEPEAPAPQSAAAPRQVYTNPAPRPVQMEVPLAKAAIGAGVAFVVGLLLGLLIG